MGIIGGNALFLGTTNGVLSLCSSYSIGKGLIFIIVFFYFVQFFMRLILLRMLLNTAP